MFVRSTQAYSRGPSRASFHQPCLEHLKKRIIGYQLKEAEGKSRLLPTVDFTLDPILDEKLKKRQMNQSSAALKALVFMVSLATGALFYKKVVGSLEEGE